ncbi:MAG: hypothetical protein IJ190_13715 [Prevotella sp.]|nr:hypothetical protein [Prevotella sp.]
MKRFAIFAFMASNSMCLMAQTYNESDDFTEVAIVILILVLSVIMVVHMIYELFIRKNPFAPISLEEMKAQREAEGLPVLMSQEEYEQCSKLMDDEYAQWTPIPGNVNDARLYTSKKEMDHAIDTFNQIRALKPTDKNLIDICNVYLSVGADGRKRQFNGSMVLLILVALFAALFIFIAGKEGGYQMALFVILMGGIYYMSSLTPTFLLFDRELNGSNGKGCMGAVFAGLGGMILGARTIKTTTKWSDGTTSTDYDNTEHTVSWVIALIVTSIVIFTLFIWSFFNYLRNYVFYY